MQLKTYLERAWDDYVRLTPDALTIHRLLSARGEQLINDHIALRTFKAPGLGRLELGSLFEACGYRAQEDLDFTEKKLKATSYIHDDPSLPKVFISELLTEKFSPALQDWVGGLTEQARRRAGKLTFESLLTPHWDPVRFEDYERFYPESEYAAWTAAIGIRINHFTVYVNALKTFGSLEELNSFLVSNGIRLNDAGGVVKGTPAEKLEQSSTMARRVPWTFAGGVTREVMGCYYEFARRYAGADGKIFQGFIPKSADKIFESTFERK